MTQTNNARQSSTTTTRVSWGDIDIQGVLTTMRELATDTELPSRYQQAVNTCNLVISDLQPQIEERIKQERGGLSQSASASSTGGSGSTSGSQQQQSGSQIGQQTGQTSGQTGGMGLPQQQQQDRTG